MKGYRRDAMQSERKMDGIGTQACARLLLRDCIACDRGDCCSCLGCLESLLISAAVLVVATATHILLQVESRAEQSGAGQSGAQQTHMRSRECECEPGCSVTTWAGAADSPRLS